MGKTLLCRLTLVEGHHFGYIKYTVRGFMPLVVCAQLPRSGIDADLTPLTKCRFNRPPLKVGLGTKRDVLPSCLTQSGKINQLRCEIEVSGQSGQLSGCHGF